MEPITMLAVLFGIVAIFNGKERNDRQSGRLGEEIRRSRQRRGLILGTTLSKSSDIAGLRESAPRNNGQGRRNMTLPIRPMPIWVETGWNFTSRGYVGKYKTPYGSWDLGTSKD